jgi:hypothetical protein
MGSRCVIEAYCEPGSCVFQENQSNVDFENENENENTNIMNSNEIFKNSPVLENSNKNNTKEVSKQIQIPIINNFLIKNEENEKSQKNPIKKNSLKKQIRQETISLRSKNGNIIKKTKNGRNIYKKYLISVLYSKRQHIQWDECFYVKNINLKIEKQMKNKIRPSLIKLKNILNQDQERELDRRLSDTKNIDVVISQLNEIVRVKNEK